MVLQLNCLVYENQLIKNQAISKIITIRVIITEGFLFCRKETVINHKHCIAQTFRTVYFDSFINKRVGLECCGESPTPSPYTYK